ncbi:hypothetical protein Tco_1506768, partial [Tanacetum coccineum]
PSISLVQHDVEIQRRHGQDMEFEYDFDAAKEVSTADLDVSTAEPVSTAGAVVTTTSVAVSTVRPTVSKTKLQQEQERLGYEAAARLQAELEEEETQRISRVHEEASSFNVEEWEDIQARVKADKELAHRIQVEEIEKYTEAEQARMLIELINQRKMYFTAQRAEQRRNKPPTQAQQRNYMSNYIKHMGSHTLQQLRGYSFDEIKTLFETTMRRVNTFVPIESEVNRAIPELAPGSLKRDAEEELNQGSSKRQKTDESSELAEEPRDKEDDERSQEELQQMMIVVPEQGMNVEALQTKYLLIDWEIYTEGTRKDDLKLYDSCGVHHVSTEKGIYIYMLVEKEYPLSRGTLTLMLGAKLLVEQDNEMSRELCRKIFLQAKRPRR